MVNVFIYGLDQFVVGDISVELTPALAKLYEVHERDINFVAPETMVFHKGVEQTSWRVIVEVKAPIELHRLQEQAKEIIFHYLKEISIHIEVTFSYYERSHRFLHLNKEYPEYLTEKEHHEDFDSEDDEEYVEGEGEDEIYTGDMFENIEEFEHDDDEEDEECSCGHHHHH